MVCKQTEWYKTTSHICSCKRFVTEIEVALSCQFSFSLSRWRFLSVNVKVGRVSLPWPLAWLVQEEEEEGKKTLAHGCLLAPSLACFLEACS